MIEEKKCRYRCCFTGHRPEKLGCGEATAKAKLCHAIDEAIQDGYVTFISGMARGVDIWGAELVLERRATNPALHLICALPYAGFEQRWSPQWQMRYQEILQQADLIKTICPSYSMAAFPQRNEWMVDHSRRLIAIYSGSPGGTRNTLEYAKQKKLEIAIYDPKNGTIGANGKEAETPYKSLLFSLKSAKNTVTNP